mgnify:CR=1 FL=1|tara:strand:+ start:7685 stop:8311 length:627 start_codon:yes stop_codon:yes gene_type:complete
MILNSCFYDFLKRFSDITFSVIILVIIFPFLILISISILISSGKPIFFKQDRIGLKGKYFKMYKFRSMIDKTEHKLTGYYTFEGDKRITKIGKYLRRYSLDELPQFYNVLKGDMSIVGPRPAIHDELSHEVIDEDKIGIIKERTFVRPGLTGLSQVKERNDIDWNKKLYYDSIYLRYKPLKRLLLDINIIFRTIFAIFSSKGVYDKKN